VLRIGFITRPAIRKRAKDPEVRGERAYCPPKESVCQKGRTVPLSCSLATPPAKARHLELGTRDLSDANLFHLLLLGEETQSEEIKARSKLPNSPISIRYLLPSHSVVNPLDLSSVRDLLQREHFQVEAKIAVPAVKSSPF
jgi:hypothetical protein